MMNCDMSVYIVFIFFYARDPKIAGNCGRTTDVAWLALKKTDPT